MEWAFLQRQEERGGEGVQQPPGAQRQPGIERTDEATACREGATFEGVGAIIRILRSRRVNTMHDKEDCFKEPTSAV